MRAPGTGGPPRACCAANAHPQLLLALRYHVHMCVLMVSPPPAHYAGILIIAAWNVRTMSGPGTGGLPHLASVCACPRALQFKGVPQSAVLDYCSGVQWGADSCADSINTGNACSASLCHECRTSVLSGAGHLQQPSQASAQLGTYVRKPQASRRLKHLLSVSSNLVQSALISSTSEFPCN